jgi:hypothetical protein
MVVRVSLLLPFVAALIFSACGGGNKAGHQKIEGPFVELFGAQTKTFSIAADKLAVMCKPKPGLKEFEFEAATAAGTDGGNYFRLTISDYTGPGDFELEFDSTRPLHHKIEVGVPAQPKGADGKDYKYTFWYYQRTDTNETYRSHCDLNLAADEGSTKTHFAGLLDCTMLFAASSSRDNSPGYLNAYVDLMAKFECDY